MKKLSAGLKGCFAAAVFLPVLFLIAAGCESVVPVSGESAGINFKESSAYAPYTAAKIDIMPLTRFAKTAGDKEGTKIKLYVSLLDSFGSQIKSPAVFRFELYEDVQRSAEPKGKRIVIWPDIDLTAAAENNSHWRDFLRAYEFGLDFDPKPNQGYILQITSLCPNGKRLSAEFNLKYSE